MEISKTILCAFSFKLTILGAQLAGTFPVSLSEQNAGSLLVKSSWKSFGLIIMLFRVFLFVSNLFSYAFLDLTDYLIAKWSNTMTSFEGATHTMISFSDFVTGVLLLSRINKFNKFLINLQTVFSDLCDENVQNEVRTREILKRFIAKRRFIKWTICCITFYCLLSWGFVLMIYEMVNPDRLAFESLTETTYYIVTLHLRLLSFFPIVAFLHIFEAGFSFLRCQVVNLEVGLLVDKFTRFEELLQEFIPLFSFQLTTGVATILASMLNVGFIMVVKIMRYSPSQEMSWGQFFTDIPLAISYLITFYLLCDSSSQMTFSAMECIWEFRKCADLHTLEAERKNSFMKFYIEKAIKPLRICPNSLFTLGLSLLPTVSTSTLHIF